MFVIIKIEKGFMKNEFFLLENITVACAMRINAKNETF